MSVFPLETTILVRVSWIQWYLELRAWTDYSAICYADFFGYSPKVFWLLAQKVPFSPKKYPYFYHWLAPFVRSEIPPRGSQFPEKASNSADFRKIKVEYFGRIG